MSTATAALGRLACQHNSFLKEFSAQVLSCTRVPNAKNVFDIVCNDSVLFPEGGGQPGDTGTLWLKSQSDERSQVAFPVTKTFPQNGQCVIRTTHEFHPGDLITMTVDWKRRYDHMQQHSAQHLISAIAESPPLNVQTTTWSLGATRCNVELNSTAITQNQLDTLEHQVNEAIARAKPISLHYQDKTSNVRLVVIEGLDTNPCCGTHVHHTGQLQRLFISCSRLQREVAMTKLWSCPPENHVDRLQKVLQEQSIATKDLKKMRFELAQLLAENLATASTAYAYLHREEPDASFLQAVSYAYRALESQKPLLLTAGSAIGEGLVLISGPEAFVAEHAQVIVKILDGKGGGIKGLFQGKVKNLSNFPLVQAHLDGHLSKVLK